MERFDSSTKTNRCETNGITFSLYIHNISLELLHLFIYKLRIEVQQSILAQLLLTEILELQIQLELYTYIQIAQIYTHIYTHIQTAPDIYTYIDSTRYIHIQQYRQHQIYTHIVQTAPDIYYRQHQIYINCNKIKARRVFYLKVINFYRYNKFYLSNRNNVTTIELWYPSLWAVVAH